MTPPYGPVMISLDAGLQQEPIRSTTARSSTSRNTTVSSPPQGDTGAVKEAARLLANAERPVIVVDRAARTAERRAAAGAACRGAAGPRRRHGRPHELPEDALSQRRRRGGQQRRRHHRHGAVRLLGRGERLRRQRRARHRPQPHQDQAGHQADQHQLVRAAHQVELPGLPALPVGRRVDAGGRRGDAAGADRSGEGGDPERPQGRDRKARRGGEEGQGRRRRRAARKLAAIAWDASPISTARLVDGDLGRHQGRRLVAGFAVRQRQQLAAAAVADGEAPPLARRLRRLWRRLRRAGVGRRRARQPRSRPLLGLDPVGRRSDVRAGRAVDRGEAQDSAARRDAQQPRLSSGADARAADGELPQPRRQLRRTTWARSAPAS